MGWPLLLITLLVTTARCGGGGGPDRRIDAAAAPPNVLIVVADDLGREVGCYGDSQARTPALDALAREATRFSRAYVTQASCSPSRSSILTGRWPHATGQIGLSHLGYAMDSAYANVASVLHARGYRTGIIGKLHVAPRSAFPFDWGLGGFDTEIAPGPPPAAMRVPIRDARDRPRVSEEKFTRFDVGAVADSAAAFVGRARAEARPWLLMVNYLDPHRPFRYQINGHPAAPRDSTAFAPPGWLAPLRPDWANQVAGYYNGAARFDDALAALLARLRDADALRGTLVIVLGDHGAPLSRAKATVYEAGLAVPLLVRWPDGARAGETHAGFVSTLDLLPTIARAAGAESALPHDLPGRPLQDLLGGRLPPRRYAFGEFTAHTPRQVWPQRSIRDERYKLIHTPLAAAYAAMQPGEWPEFELYDLRADSFELDDRYGDPALDSVAVRLRQNLLAWQRATGDPLLDETYRAKLRAQLAPPVAEDAGE